MKMKYEDIGGLVFLSILLLSFTHTYKILWANHLIFRVFILVVSGIISIWILNSPLKEIIKYHQKKDSHSSVHKDAENKEVNKA